MFKVIFISLVSIATLFAGGGGGGGSVGGGNVGGSFGSYENSDKYGEPQTIENTSSLGGNLNLVTYIHVRAQNWFTVLNWTSGYATSKVKKDGKLQVVDELEIRQYSISNIGGNVIYSYSSDRVINEKRTSNVRLGLSEVDDSGVVVTQHLFRVNGKTYVNNIQNDWGGQGVTFNIYSSGPAGPATPWNIYTDPIANLAKSLLF